MWPHLIRQRLTWSVALAIAALTGACFRQAGQLVREEPPPPTSHVDPGLATEARPHAGPYVPAGTELTIALDDAIGTDTSSPGQDFSARVDADLFAPSGELVVARGAPVRGKVARVEGGRAPLLALDLTSIETPRGTADVTAMLDDAHPVALPNRGERYDPRRSSYDAFFTAWYLPGPIGYAAPPSSTFDEDYYDERESRIRLPKGARLRLELRRDLVPRAQAE